MEHRFEFQEKPIAKEIFMIAGWHQWADAGSISSALPHYLIDLTDARKIGEIKPDGFYLYQIPGTHHFLRPEIKMVDGYRQEVRSRKNEFYYTGNDQKGLVIFTGDEPHLDIDRYADTFFAATQELKVKRVAAVGGVYGAMPYELDRQVSCVYSLPRMQEEMRKYAVRFSNYEGGASIGTYLVDCAEKWNVEYLSFYAFVPAYDFSQLSSQIQGVRIDNDFKAWYELMRRFNYMFDLGLDLSDLEQNSSDLMITMEEKINELAGKMPDVKIKEYMQMLAAEFTETPFMPLDDIWERELGDLFDDQEDG